MENIVENKEIRLHLGCGKTILEGWVNIDQVPLEGVDIVADLNECRSNPLPFEDNTVSEIFSSHFIEHIQDTLGLMEELYRVAKSNTRAVFRLPFGGSDDAYEDLTHVRAYFLNSFGYFSQPYYWRADYGYKGDWEVEEIILVVDKEKYGQMPYKEIMEQVYHLRNIVQEMIVILKCVKPKRETKKELQNIPYIQIKLQ